MSIRDLDAEPGVTGNLNRDERRRLHARGLVAAAGFGPWKKVVNRAVAMLIAGHSDHYITSFLSRTIPRLPR